MRATAVDIRGDEELMAALKKLEGTANDKLLRDALAKGAQAMKPAVKAEIHPGKTHRDKSGLVHVGGSSAKPSQPGDLARSISMKRGRRTRPPAAIVYPNRKKGGWYAPFVIRGTASHLLSKRKSVRRLLGFGYRHPGSDPDPFITRGGRAGTPAALAKIKQHLAAYIESLD